MSAYTQETVLSVRHWTDSLFSFTTTRSPSFRFSNGQFTMMGLETDGGRPLVRAYSMASPNYEDTLEFFSIKVPDGPLTSRLQHIKESRPHPGQQEADRHAGGRQPAARPLPLSAEHRHRAWRRS